MSKVRGRGRRWERGLLCLDLDAEICQGLKVRRGDRVYYSQINPRDRTVVIRFVTREERA